VAELKLRKEDVAFIIALALLVIGGVALITRAIDWEEFYVIIVIAVGLIGGGAYLKARRGGRQSETMLETLCLSCKRAQDCEAVIVRAERKAYAIMKEAFEKLGVTSYSLLNLVEECSNFEGIKMRVKVTIVSAAGTLRDFEANSMVRVERVKREAMEALHIPPELSDRYWLRWGDTKLDDDRTLHEQGVGEGALLYLETAPPRVG